jgi:hypothetical protein
MSLRSGVLLVTSASNPGTETWIGFWIEWPRGQPRDARGGHHGEDDVLKWRRCWDNSRRSNGLWIRCAVFEKVIEWQGGRG